MTRTVVFLVLAMMTAAVLVAPAASANWMAGCYGDNEVSPGRFPPEVCAALRPAGAAVKDVVCTADPDNQVC